VVNVYPGAVLPSNSAITVAYCPSFSGSTMKGMGEKQVQTNELVAKGRVMDEVQRLKREQETRESSVGVGRRGLVPAPKKDVPIDKKDPSFDEVTFCAPRNMSAQAVPQLMDLAKKGKGEAQALVGYSLLVGLGTKQDEKQALQWLLKGGEQGNAIALMQLGTIYEDGKCGVKKDDIEALKWYKLAAAQAEPNAQYQLGLFYLNGRGGLPKNEESALVNFLAAGQGGIGEAQYMVGNFCELGRGGLPKDDVAAAQAYVMAADAGVANAGVSLGQFYCVGRGGLPKDDVKALEYFQMAALQGLAAARFNIGVFHLDGRGGLAKDAKKAVEYFQIAADQGLPNAQLKLGLLYLKGNVVVKDAKKAMDLYHLAASRGYAEAQFMLGCHYASGEHGLPKDDKKAADLFERATKQNHAGAEFLLGLFYANGWGVPKDEKKACQLYQLAANKGFAEAVVQLRLMHDNGWGGDGGKAAGGKQTGSETGRRIYAMSLGNANYLKSEKLVSCINDAKAMKDFWTSIGGTVEMKTDLSSTEMRRIVRDCSRHLEQHAEKYDLFVFYFSGHGSSEAIVGTDEAVLSFEEVVEFFNGNHLPEFVAKPKLFIWDCCRGRTVNPAVVTKAGRGGEIYYAPDSEMCHFYATTERHVSYGGGKDSDMGIFTKYLLEVLKSHNERDLYDIHRETSARMKKFAAKDHSGVVVVQLPELRGMLSTKVLIPNK
jgi:TPR repeat protein